jgi:hypothetical protein
MVKFTLITKKNKFLLNYEPGLNKTISVFHAYCDYTVSKKTGHLFNCDVFEARGFMILNFNTRKVCYSNNELTQYQWRKPGLKSGGGGRIHGERLKF